MTRLIGDSILFNWYFVVHVFIVQSNFRTSQDYFTDTIMDEEGVELVESITERHGIANEFQESLIQREVGGNT